MALQFSYCECGCKGSESATIGRTSFWIYNDLEGSFYLHKGHGHTSPLLKKCKSHEEAVGLATEKAKVLLAEEQAVLDAIRQQVEDKPVKPKTFDQALNTEFPGPINAVIRRLIRRCKTAQQIRDLANTSVFSDKAQTSLLLVAKSFKNRPKR